MADGDDKEEEREQNIKTDPRVAVIMGYTLKAFKVGISLCHVLRIVCLFFLSQVRLEKWIKMTSQEENQLVLNHFLDKADFRVLVISQSAAGVLQPSNSFPDTIKHKTIYFVKRLATSVLVT